MMFCFKHSTRLQALGLLESLCRSDKKCSQSTLTILKYSILRCSDDARMSRCCNMAVDLTEFLCWTMNRFAISCASQKFLFSCNQECSERPQVRVRLTCMTVLCSQKDYIPLINPKKHSPIRPPEGLWRQVTPWRPAASQSLGGTEMGCKVSL